MFLVLFVHLITQTEMNGFNSNFNQSCFSNDKTIDYILGTIWITTWMQDQHYGRITWISRHSNLSVWINRPSKILFKYICKKTIYDVKFSQPIY